MENVRISLMRPMFRAVTAIALLIAFILPLTGAAQAGSGVTFTLTIASAYARLTPSTTSEKVFSLFKGQSYPVIGKTEDGEWLRLEYAGNTFETWILKAYGKVQGNLSDVPVVTPGVVLPVSSTSNSSAGATANTNPPAPNAYYPSDYPVIPVVSRNARDIYERGIALGNKPDSFSKIGDCQAVPPYFLASFDYGNYSLGSYAELQAAIDYYSGSWARESVAANRGFNVSSVFVNLWADPKRCAANESPLVCEFRLNRPSIAIISMETWWTGEPTGYESYLRSIIEFSIARGTVPILATKADNKEGTGAINAVIVKLAKEYDVPLWNFWAAVQPLPNHGLHNDGFHLTFERNHFDDATAMQMGWPVRNLTALQAIDAVWKAVSAP